MEWSYGLFAPTKRSFIFDENSEANIEWIKETQYFLNGLNMFHLNPNKNYKSKLNEVESFKQY